MGQEFAPTALQFEVDDASGGKAGGLYSMQVIEVQKPSPWAYLTR